MLRATLFGLITDTVPVAPTDWVSYLTTWGPSGFFLALVLTGILEPKRVRQGLETERNDWRQAFETERSAHELTRQSLAAANTRADAALVTASTMTRILEATGHPTRGTPT